MYTAVNLFECLRVLTQTSNMSSSGSGRRPTYFSETKTQRQAISRELRSTRHYDPSNTTSTSTTGCEKRFERARDAPRRQDRVEDILRLRGWSLDRWRLPFLLCSLPASVAGRAHEYRIVILHERVVRGDHARSPLPPPTKLCMLLVLVTSRSEIAV